MFKICSLQMVGKTVLTDEESSAAVTTIVVAIVMRSRAIFANTISIVLRIYTYVFLVFIMLLHVYVLLMGPCLEQCHCQALETDLVAFRRTLPHDIWRIPGTHRVPFSTIVFTHPSVFRQSTFYILIRLDQICTFREAPVDANMSFINLTFPPI